MIKTDWVAVCSHPMEFFCRLCSSLYRNVKNEYKFFYVGCKTKLVCQPRSVVALPSTYLAVCQPRPVVSLPSTYLAYLNFFHKNFVLTVQLFQISAAAVVDSSTFLAGAHRSYDVRAVAYQNIRYKLDGSKVI